VSCLSDKPIQLKRAQNLLSSRGMNFKILYAIDSITDDIDALNAAL